jgi:hypothetical protein
MKGNIACYTYANPSDNWIGFVVIHEAITNSEFPEMEQAAAYTPPAMRTSVRPVY